MKQSSFLVTFLLFTIFLDAQKKTADFVAEAKLVTVNNDTIYGTASIDSSYKYNNFKNSNIGQVFYFKKNGATKSEKYKPKQLNGFHIKTNDDKWAEFISSQTLENFFGEAFYQKVFLLKIIEGNVNLYYYYHIDHNLSGGGFIMNPGGSVRSEPFRFEAIEKNLTKILYKKGATKIYHSDIYEAWQSKMINFVKDCPDLVSKLKEVKCKGWSFFQVATYYNNCK